MPNEFENNVSTHRLGRSALARRGGEALGAQPLDAKLLTPRGWVPMGDICIGDEVITQSGASTLVNDVIPRGAKEIFRVALSDHTSAECCDEHLWLTRTYRERGYAQRAAKAGKEWLCAKPRHRSLQEIKSTLRAPHLGAKNHSIPIVAPVHFGWQRPLLNPYLVGALLGDGHIGQKAVSIANADQEVFDALVLPADARIRLNAPANRCPTAHLLGTRPGINPVLIACRQLGLSGLLSHEKFVPESYKFNSKEVRLAVLRGLMDTDGWVQREGRHVCFASASVRLTDDVAFLVQSLGGVATKSQKATSYSYRGEMRAGRPSFTLTINLPRSINPFSISRKASAVVAKTKYQPTRYIVAVDRVGRREAQCIQVEHPSQMYLTDAMIVTCAQSASTPEL